MLVLIRGAGDLASGIALRLIHAGFSCILTDLPRPTSIRRTVAFSEALLKGSCRVEELTAQKAETAADALRLLEYGIIPVIADPDCTCLEEIRPQILVDAIIAKRNIGTRIDMAPVVIGVGPGFTAGADCHAVVETMRGHTLGRVYLTGSALPNTNIPGLIGGFAGERVIRAPKEGIFIQAAEIGTIVSADTIVGYVGEEPVRCTISGVLRGILPDGTPVHTGMKSGDVDPRGDRSACYLVSDKALAIGGGVLEACLRLTREQKLC